MGWFDRPILFLDIDGVLNSLEYAKGKEARGEKGCLGIDPAAVVHLQRIVDETDCSIVLSSTWRLGPPGTLSNVRGKLVAAGMRHPCPLRDRTPDLSYKVTPEGRGLYAGVRRGEEVKHWIESHGYEGPYCCIDDDSDFLPGQPLVKTSFNDGITAEHANRVIEILRGAVTVTPDP